MDMTQTSNINELDVEWHVVALLPPGDMTIGTEKLKSLLNSTKIKFKQPSLDLSGIKINSITVLPECFCAYIGTVYESLGMIRSGYSEITKGITLVADIGAGTTDWLIVEDGHMVDNSRNTVEIGGNNVRAKVRSKIREQYGFKPTEVDTTQAIVRGYIKDGSKKINILNITDSAREEVAASISNELKDFLEEITYNMRRIDNFLVCGGGTVIGNIDKAELMTLGFKEEDLKERSLGEILFQYVSEYAPNIQLVPLPKKKVKDSSGIETEQEISPRMLNVVGASIIANKLVG
jgi:hypothetical protein